MTQQNAVFEPGAIELALLAHEAKHAEQFFNMFKESMEGSGLSEKQLTEAFKALDAEKREDVLKWKLGTFDTKEKAVEFLIDMEVEAYAEGEKVLSQDQGIVITQAQAEDKAEGKLIRPMGKFEDTKQYYRSKYGKMYDDLGITPKQQTKTQP